MSLFGWWQSGAKEDAKEDQDKDAVREDDGGTKGEDVEEPSKSPETSTASFWNMTFNSESLSKGMNDLVSSVKSYATNLSTTVGDVSVFSELEREQEKFAKKRRQEKDAAVPPWVGYNEEEEMKKQIIDLSADQRNFLRPPPSGVQFHFDFTHSYPIAMALLEEDKRLQKMRFEYVPKKISEVDFWRNLFYRISLIKQAVQISSANKEEEEDKGDHEKVEVWQEESPLVPSSTETGHSPQPEFASDELVVSTEGVTSDAIKQELKDLGMSETDGKEKEGSNPAPKDTDNIEDWEAALQDELDQMTLEGDGDVLPEDTEGWEKELEQLLEAKS